MAVFYTDYFSRAYKARWNSISGLITLIFYAMAILLPLFLVLKTHSKYIHSVSEFNFRLLGKKIDIL